MVSQSFSKIFIVGGTGAQGLPIVRSLVQDGKYTVRVLTRDRNSRRSQLLQALGNNVELFEGSFMNEADLRGGYDGCDAAFINIDGFNTGEKTEMFWAIRCYELAIENGGVKFFVYGNPPYTYKKAGYKKEFRAGHYDGKGRIGEWIVWQSGEAAKASANAMGAALFSTGPYMEMVIDSNTPMTPGIEKGDDGKDTLTWRVPLTPESAVPHVALDDCGHYVRWLFDNPERANGMDLVVAIDHISYGDMAAAFAEVTGKPARFVPTSTESYFEHGPLSAHAKQPSGYSADLKDPATLSVRENFTGAWNVWANGRSLIPVDYALLDEIHPKRIRSAEEWFRREDEKGRLEGNGSLWERVQPQAQRSILKLHEDGFKSPTAQH